MVTNVETTFPSGASSGTLCLSSQSRVDTVIEGQEVYSISFNSTDEALSISDNVAVVTIVDESAGGCCYLKIRLGSITLDPGS